MPILHVTHTLRKPSSLRRDELSCTALLRDEVLGEAWKGGGNLVRDEEALTRIAHLVHV